MQETQGTAEKIPNFFEWWLVDEPVLLWGITVKITRRVLIFFSIPVLIKTLFSPWKRDVHSAVNSSLDVIVKVLVDNLISRLIGFVVRLITIAVGLLVTTITFVAGIAFLLFWFFLPVLAFGVILWGFNGRIF